ARSVRQVLDFPAKINPVAFLRPEPESLAERRVPSKCARPFDGAARFVAVPRHRRLHKHVGIEETEWRSTANSPIRVSNLVRAERNNPPGSVVRSGATEQRCEGRPRVPGDNILQPPVSKRMCGPAVRSIAMMFSE